MTKKTIKIYLLISIVLISTAQGTVLTYAQTQEKNIYLTFDDGPTKEVTLAILDVLKEQDVKATFFVVGKEIDQREHVLKRIYEEGHTIGLHSYSHNLRKVYASTEGFIQEMEQTKDKINEVLGTAIDFKIIRFPGGSAGRLDEEMLDKLHQQGYKIYDWTISLEDGVNPHLSPTQLLQNAKKSRYTTQEPIILAHCNANNKTTPQALGGIIAYYKDKGYRFKAIDATTKEFYYRIRDKK